VRTVAFIAIAGVAVVVQGSPPVAAAAQQPIAADSLRLRRDDRGTRILFISRDAAALFPAIGSPDDPSSGRGGLILEIFTQGGVVAIQAPWNETAPRWKVFDARVDHFAYRDPDAPSNLSQVRRGALREGRLVRIRGIADPLASDGPLGPVAVRVTTGSLRNCALFGAATIRRDTPSSFFAVDAPSDALADCSDETLSAAVGLGCEDSASCGGVCPGEGRCGFDLFASVCRCVFPTDPCGDTAPICNGSCAAGEECVPIVGYATDDCVCTPIGVTPCGAHGQHPTCEVACPDGNECLPYRGKFNSSCGCGDDRTCEEGGLRCPAGLECMEVPGFPRACIPVFCGGSASFPTCGGTCENNGWGCRPLRDFDGEVEICACAPPADCDASSGGLDCPANQVCQIDDSLARSCEPL